MAVSDLVWLLVLLVFIQPVFRQQWRDYSRSRLIEEIEAKRSSRVILLVHRLETMNFLGVPIMRYIDIDDAEQVLQAIRETDPATPIDFVMHTPGGVALAAMQIARALKSWPGKVTVHVPHYAMSGGTLIAFAAGRICMTEHAVLGPVDPQVGGFPAASILSVTARKGANDVDDETLILADIAHRAVEQMRGDIEELLGPDDTERARQLAELFTEGAWTHDRAVTVNDLRGLGFNVDTDMPREILELMTLYGTNRRRARTVTWLKRRS